MIIERNQKRVLFEEATRKGIRGSEILSIPEIFRDLVGFTDIGGQRYGAPLAPIYEAKENEMIDVDRISMFFKGLLRDIRVSDISLVELENTLSFLDLEVWSRIQLLKNRSNNLSKKARTERLKTSIGATWLYTETLSTTDHIDLDATTAWIDASEGIAQLPTLGLDGSLAVTEIEVTNESIPTGGSNLGSSAKLAFDGSNSTNWRNVFTQEDSTASCTIMTPKNDITFIQVDPIGFGMNLTIEIKSRAGWNVAVRDILYRKTSYPINIPEVTEIRFTYSSAESSLPKTVGIKNVTILNTKTSRLATIVTKLLKPTDTFSELKIDYKGLIPEGSNIQPFYKTSSAGPWKRVVADTWQTVTDSLTRNWTGTVDGLSPDRGLYRKNLPSINDTPILTSQGTMDIGVNQVEVTAFRKDWIEEGELNKLLAPNDFDGKASVKVWSNVPFINASSSIVAQLSGSTTITDRTSITRSGDAMIFERRLDPDLYEESVSKYNQMCIVPLVGDKNKNAMQPDYNYRMKFWVHAPSRFHFKDGKYWIHQGYRTAGRRPYAEIDKSYGSFTMYVNKVLVAGDSRPLTIYTDRTSTEIETGNGFSFTLEEGWNEIEILVNVVNPAAFGEDSFDATDQEYFQIALYPSLFDNKFKQSIDTEISRVVGSGPYKPVSEFDLLWNVPKDVTFWAWKEDRTGIVFNTLANSNIDGYFYGAPPKFDLTYKGAPGNTTDDLYIRLDLERQATSRSGPLLDEFTVMVK